MSPLKRRPTREILDEKKKVAVQSTTSLNAFFLETFFYLFNCEIEE